MVKISSVKKISTYLETITVKGFPSSEGEEQREWRHFLYILGSTDMFNKLRT